MTRLPKIESIFSERVVYAGRVGPATIILDNDRIRDVVATRLPSAEVTPHVIMPGIVDCHVHMNEPGRTEWEGFASATRAASLGGITTLVDMPLNSTPVTTTARALEAKLHAAEGQLSVDVGYWGGVVPGNRNELAAMADLGARGFKCFMIDSGLEDFPATDDETLLGAMQELARLDLPLLVHAERDEGGISEAAWSSVRFADFLASRPERFEDDAIAVVLRLAEKTGCHVHIVHLSSTNLLPRIAEAKARGVRITVETCPHYLTFAAEEIADGATEFKCTPPIRSAQNRERLWQGLREGVIDLVVCDHSPCTPALKNKTTGDFSSAWGGIASLQVSLAAVWTEANRRGFGLSDIVRWMSERPAVLAGFTSKGKIQAQAHADLVLFDPEETFVVHGERLEHRHKLTPYDGLSLQGVVKRTLLRGADIGLFSNGHAPPPLRGCSQRGRL